MKQSNTYLKTDISFGGILQPMVESLERNQRQPGKLVGQEVVIYTRDDIQAIIALDAANNIHLLITPPSNGDPRLSRFELKGLKIADMEWAVASHKSQLYLDISCATGTMPSFKRPFLRFTEDVLLEISRPSRVPAEAAYATCLRWRKFWSPEIRTAITREWIHGLFGELLFLADLIERFGTGAIDSWTGPLGQDHDFQKGTDVAAEIKTSVETPVSITCNLRQLDPELFKHLYIVCYRLTSSESGITLPDMVRRVERLMSENEASLDKFYEKLTAAGYQLQLENSYAEFSIEYNQAIVYKVNDDFPKIVEKSFIKPPDHRITGIRYSLHLTGLKGLTIDSIAEQLKRFTKSS